MTKIQDFDGEKISVVRELDWGVKFNISYVSNLLCDLGLVEEVQEGFVHF